MPTLFELETLYQKGTGSRNMTPLLDSHGWIIWSGKEANMGAICTMKIQSWVFKFNIGHKKEH